MGRTYDADPTWLRGAQTGGGRGDGLGEKFQVDRSPSPGREVSSLSSEFMMMTSTSCLSSANRLVFLADRASAMTKAFLDYGDAQYGVTRRPARLLSLIIAASEISPSAKSIAHRLRDVTKARTQVKFIELARDHLCQDLLGKIADNCLHPMPIALAPRSRRSAAQLPKTRRCLPRCLS